MLVCSNALCFPPALYAQTEADDAVSTARLRLGPFAVRPRLAIQNVGVDTNVYNDVENPTRDFMGGLVSGVTLDLRLGRALVTSSSLLEWAYFAKNTALRSMNWGEDLRVELRLNRLTPYVQGVVRHGRQR